MSAREINDGFGNVWLLCDRQDCGLEIVRPGKTQCWCEGFYDRSQGGWVDGPGPVFGEVDDDVMACTQCAAAVNSYFWDQSGGLCDECLAGYALPLTKIGEAS